MKKLFISLLLVVSVANAGESCQESESVATQDVVYKVNKDMPNHLKGAKITVTLADGSSSTVPAEKFMVVPRKQQTVVGQDKVVSKNLVCSKSEKNILMAELRKDVKNIDTETTAIPGGEQVTVRSNKALIPGINYYRRELFDTRFGAGVGVDSNGTVKGMLGLDF
jgi:hypothetical protein